MIILIKYKEHKKGKTNEILLKSLFLYVYAMRTDRVQTFELKTNIFIPTTTNK